MLEIVQNFHRELQGIDEDEPWSLEVADRWKYWTEADINKAVRVFRLARLAEASQSNYQFSYTRQFLGQHWTFEEIEELRELHRYIDTINKLLGDW